MHACAVTDSFRGAKFEMKIKATAKLASFGISLISARCTGKEGKGHARGGDGGAQSRAALRKRNPIWPRSDFGDGSLFKRTQTLLLMVSRSRTRCH